MNTLKRNVRIRLTTKNDGRRTAEELAGQAYVKGGHTYIRYQETAPELEGVTTIVKIGAKEITLLRQGNVRMQQRFSAGPPASGYYETAYGMFRLETETKQIHIQMLDGLGTAEWSYRLAIGGADAGHFEVRLEVQEAMETT